VALPSDDRSKPGKCCTQTFVDDNWRLRCSRRFFANSTQTASRTCLEPFPQETRPRSKLPSVSVDGWWRSGLDSRL
jgi:hypothetical protein